MIHYKFKAKYSNNGINATLDGECSGKDYTDAVTNVQKGVANQMGSDPANVVVTSMTKFTPRKKKAKAKAA